MKKILFEIYQRIQQYYFRSGIASISFIHQGLRAIARITIIPVINGITLITAKRNRMIFPPRSKHQLAMLLGEYEQEVVALCRNKIKPKMNVIDIGAYAGYYTLLFSELVGPEGRVYAFEPQPENHTTLIHNIRNSKYPNNIIPISKAISNTVGEIQFYQHITDTAKGSLYPDQHIKTPIAILATTIDTFLAEINNPKISLVKMDMEGAENTAFEGMKSLIAANNPLWLIVECSPKILQRIGVSVKDFLSKLNKLGFTVSAIGQSGRLIVPEVAMQQSGDTDINLFCEKR